MPIKTKSTLKWQSEGQTRAKATFRASDDRHWPGAQIRLGNPKCPTRQRLIKEQDEARKRWSQRYAHALVYDKELPVDEDFPYPGPCQAGCECSSIPHEGWKVTFCWSFQGFGYYEREEVVERLSKAYDNGEFPHRPSWADVNDAVEVGKKWGHTEPPPTLPDETWIFGTRKEAQVKAEEIAAGLVDDIAAWITPIVDAKRAQEVARKAKIEANRQAIRDKFAANEKLLSDLEQKFPGLEGTAQVNGILVENPEILLEG